MDATVTEDGEKSPSLKFGQPSSQGVVSGADSIPTFGSSIAACAAWLPNSRASPQSNTPPAR